MPHFLIFRHAKHTYEPSAAEPETDQEDEMRYPVLVTEHVEGQQAQELGSSIDDMAQLLAAKLGMEL